MILTSEQANAVMSCEINLLVNHLITELTTLVDRIEDNRGIIGNTTLLKVQKFKWELEDLSKKLVPSQNVDNTEYKKDPE